MIRISMAFGWGGIFEFFISPDQRIISLLHFHLDTRKGTAEDIREAKGRKWISSRTESIDVRRTKNS